MDLAGDSNLDEIEAMWPRLGQWLRSNMIPAINNIGKQIAVSPVGALSPPDAPQSLAVKVSGEYAHVSITDNAKLQKGVQYFTEVSTSPSFSQPIVIHHGASRTSHPFPLPTNNDGGEPQTYYFRSYKQYHGSDPSAHVVYGGQQPIGVTMTGTTNMTLLPSTGSGTASGDGQQGGSGLGRVILRPTPQPKRSVNGS